MTREEREKAIAHGKEQLEVFGGEHAEFIKLAIEVLEQEPKAEQFAKWVATELFDDNWEYNKDSFEEIACRKLAELGIVRANGDEWELVDPQENEETATQNASVLKKTYEKEDYYDALETAYKKGYYDAVVKVMNREL